MTFSTGDRPDFFDPLSTEDLTAIICRKFEEQPLQMFKEEPPVKFAGAGLYAVYYAGGSVKLYRPVASTTIPVYVGRARSHNSATGEGARSANPLYGRIKQHHASIEGGGLPVTEFGVRLLELPDVHIDLGENGLRVGYQPVWNSVLTGFGSHEQGSSTRRSRRSAWDTVHYGRARTFGEDGRDRDALLERARDKIAAQVQEYFGIGQA